MIRSVLSLILLSFSYSNFAQPLPLLIPYNDGGKWGYSDNRGNIALPAKWEEARLFQNQKAIVGNFNKSRNNWIYSLIDENGNYIIAPSAGWNGDMGGWTNYRANVTDSLGRSGLTDTNGHLLIDYKWDGISGYGLAGEMKDSCKIVIKDGLQGVVNRRGEIVIPCRWADISSNDAMADIDAFIVKDPDNAKGLNAYGLVNDRNEMLLEPRFHGIGFLRLPSGPVLRVSIAADNQVPEYASTDYFQKYYAYPSGKEIFPDDSLLKLFGKQSAEKGGYVLFGDGSEKGLMDGAGHILIPCCKVQRLRGDTIFTRETLPITKDSMEWTERRLNIHTMQEYGVPEVRMIYTEPPQSFDFNFSRSYPRHEKTAPSVKIAEGYYRDKFYKDSLLLATVDYAVDGNEKLYIVQGYVYSGGNKEQSCYAIVDSSLNYIYPPQYEYRIIRYNENDDIVTVAKGNQYGLLALSGKTLLPLQQRSISKGFRTSEGVYGISGLLEEQQKASADHNFNSNNYYSETIRILDSAGTIVKTLSNFSPSASNTMDMLRSGRVIVTDSAQKIGLITLNGVSLLPEVNFKFKNLYILNGHCFFADSGNLINSKGQKLFKDFTFNSLRPSTNRVYHSDHDINILNSSNRLYLVEGRDKKSGENIHFYMNDEGKSYYSTP